MLFVNSIVFFKQNGVINKTLEGIIRSTGVEETVYADEFLEYFANIDVVRKT